MRVEHYTYGPEEREQELYQTIKAWSPETFPIGVMLPKLGVVVFNDDDIPLVFMCADMSNNIGRAYLDFFQTNPEAGRMERLRAARMAEEYLCRELKRMDYNHIVAITKKAGIAYLSQSFGYEVNPAGYTVLQKVI